MAAPKHVIELVITHHLILTVHPVLEATQRLQTVTLKLVLVIYIKLLQFAFEIVFLQ
jgi:hypothetical protein